MKELQSNNLFQNVSALLENARKRTIVAVNQTMVLTYFEVGRMIKIIEITLCQDKSNSLVEYTLPENNNQIFASK
jgi:hypothetical protein